MEKTILYVVESVWQAALFAVVTAALELLGIGVLLLCGLATPGAACRGQYNPLSDTASGAAVCAYGCADFLFCVEKVEKS